MRITSVTLFILLVSFSFGRAQEFNFGGFASLPIGNFGSEDIEKGGFARTGWGVSFEALARGEKWPKGLGACFVFSYQINEVDGPAVAQAYNDNFGGGVLATVSNTRYRPLTATFGPAYRYDFSSALHLEIKTGVGFMLSNIDPLTISLFDEQQNLLLSEEVFFQAQPVFTYLIGLNFGYDFTDFLGVRVFVNHSSATEEYSTVDDPDSRQNISYINPGLSLSLEF